MRLSVRLAVLFSLFGLAIAAGFLIYYVGSLRREAYSLALQKSELTATAVRIIVEEEFRSARRPSSRLGRSLEEIVRSSEIATVVVKDRRGKRLIGRSDSARWLSRQARPGIPIESVRDGIYDVERPVDLGLLGEGSLIIGFHLGALQGRLAQLASEAVQGGVMALLAITLAAWLMGTWFGSRIERLVPRLEGLPRDPEGFKPLRVEGSDEVSRLVAAFNSLGGSLKEETLRRRELESEKRELAAMLVHDLKTPLTVIQSGVTLLKEQLLEFSGAPAAVGGRSGSGQRGNAHRRTFELLEMSSQRLHRMVEDVLQLSRLEEMPGLRESVPIDLIELAKGCARDFALIAADREQKISLALPKKGEIKVLGEAALLRRVLDNFVHNAVEHTPSEGTITIAISVRNGNARVGVSDSGPGVPEEAKAHIFQKFFQEDLKRHVGNVGLGLALCEKVIRRHGGLIGVEDAKPRGACFYFLLPLAQPDLALDIPPATEAS